MADLEDALKKLDRLTQEEARMALAEVLRITHNVRDEVKVVDCKVERMEDKVEVIGDKVEVMGDQLQCVDEKVQVVIDGARGVSSQSPMPSNMYTLDSRQARGEAKESKLTIQQAASGIDEIKCSWLANPAVARCSR